MLIIAGGFTTRSSAHLASGDAAGVAPFARLLSKYCASPKRFRYTTSTSLQGTSILTTSSIFSSINFTFYFYFDFTHFHRYYYYVLATLNPDKYKYNN